jgi:hypothetical protein
MKPYWLASAAILVCTACAEPTAVRRTLLIPSPVLPSRVGAPLDPMHGRVGLELSSIAVPMLLVDVPNFGGGEQGEPGVLVPRLHLGAAFHIGLFSFWEAGVRVLYTHASWSSRNFPNVIALPDDQDGSLYELAISHRINFLRDLGPWQAFNAALLLELGVGSTAEAVYCQEQQGCEGAPSADPGYLVHETDRYLFFRPQLALSLGAFAHELVFVDVLFGTTTSLDNVGFDRLENIDDETNGMFWIGYFGGGVDVRYEMVFATLHLYFPFEGEDRIYFGPRLSARAGYAF